MKFLYEIAKSFYNSEKSNIHRYCFVFPNRRAGVFFQKYLGECSEKALFSPKITSVKEMFLEISGLREANRADLLSRLYRIYCTQCKSPESFDDFIYWGEIILNDFDDVDKYMVDASKLFNNIKDLKEIESDYSFLSERQIEAIRSFWESFLPADSSDKKVKFKSLWELLYPLYKNLREELILDGIGYEGMIFREVAEYINREAIESYCNRYEEIVFIGFNALSRCEKRLLKEIKSLNKGDFYWDFYGNIITDRENRASLFLRDNIVDFPSKREIHFDHYEFPDTEIITLSSSVGEAKTIWELLRSGDISTDINTAVVLPDEKMLMPMLYSIPQEVTSVNITMGYPLNSSPAVALIEQLIELRQGENPSKKGYYYKRVIPILENPYIRGVVGEESERLRNDIIKNNIVYITDSLLSEYESLREMFVNIDERSYTDYLIGVLDKLLKRRGRPIGKIELEHLSMLYKIIISIGNIKEKMSGATYRRLLLQAISSYSIPFRGEPLSGLQIMGVLETRALDFDNVIICSMNEGYFPKQSSSASYIPQNLRIGFGLPDMTFQDSIEAYYFYRLIGRAKRLYLLCDSRTDGLTGGEPSRYIYQLKYHYQVKIRERVVVYDIHSIDKREIIIDKKCMAERQEHMPDSISPSSLQTYIDCPLKFYFQYVKKIRREERVSEEVESDTFGIVFHKAMQSIYRDFIGKEVTAMQLEQLCDDKAKIRSVVERLLLKEQGIREINGYYLIVSEMIIRYVEQVIRYDKGKAPFRYLKSEEAVNSGRIEYDSGKSVEIKGIIDRIDTRYYPEYGEIECIIDYKTGGGDSDSVELQRDKNLSLLLYPPQNKKFSISLQMYLYAMITNREKVVVIAPYVLRSLFSKEKKKRETIVTPEEISLFERLLKERLKEMYDLSTPFVQSTDRQKCKYCDFNFICN